MSRSDRLIRIIARLRDGKLHRAHDLAAEFNVSPRTLYRDMDRIIASGVPVAGKPGTGYQITDAITLPPLNLSQAELEALTLGLAIVAQSADPGLKSGASELATRIETLLPSQTIAAGDTWRTALAPFADASRGFAHIPVLRAAISARQKLKLTYNDLDATVTTSTIRPLRLDFWGRVWTLMAWCETSNDFKEFRVDLIEDATPLPTLFVDDPGKTLADLPRAC